MTAQDTKPFDSGIATEGRQGHPGQPLVRPDGGGVA
jgi:hypothetical protein